MNDMDLFGYSSSIAILCSKHKLGMSVVVKLTRDTQHGNECSGEAC